MKRADVVLTVLVAVIVAAGAVAGVVASRRGPAHYDAGSPAGVVQRYLTATAGGDLSAAAQLLSSTGGCTEADLERAPTPASFRAVLRQESTTGSTATVTVEVSESLDAPFGEGFTHTERYALSRADGPWRLTGTPWPLYVCGTEKAPS